MSNKQPWTGEKARQLREELGLSQKKFAEACGIPLGTVCSIERRRANKLTTGFQYMYSDIDRKTSILRSQFAELRDQLVAILAQK